MARKIRMEYAGAVHHVMARDNQGRSLFVDDLDHKLWLDTLALAEACAKNGWRIHASVLLGNHYHLLVETPEANPMAGMKWLQSTYTQRYNSRHEVFGQRLWMGEESGVTRAVRRVKHNPDAQLKRMKVQLPKGVPE